MEKQKNPEILDLTKDEINILERVIEPISIAELSRKTSIPRSSLVYMIDSLLKRKLLIKNRHGKRVFYEKNKIEEIQKLSNLITQFFDPSLSVFTMPTFEDIRLYKGLDAIMKIQLETMANAPRHSRVKGTQSNKSLIALFDNTPIEYTVKFNGLISSRKIILVGLIETSMYKTMEDYWKRDPEGEKEMTKSFGNRTTDYVALPPGMLNFNGEIWIYLDVAIIINWSDKIAVYIKNRDIYNMINSIFDICKQLGERVNHQIELDKIIKVK